MLKRIFALENVVNCVVVATEIDAIGLLQATSPCVQPEHFRQAAIMMKQKGYDSVFSVVRKHCFRWKETNPSGKSCAKVFAKFFPLSDPDGELFLRICN